MARPLLIAAAPVRRVVAMMMLSRYGAIFVILGLGFEVLLQLFVWQCMFLIPIIFSVRPHMREPTPSIPPCALGRDPHQAWKTGEALTGIPTREQLASQ